MERHVKRVAWIFFSLMFALIFAACGNGSGEGAGLSESAATPPALSDAVTDDEAYMTTGNDEVGAEIAAPVTPTENGAAVDGTYTIIVEPRYESVLMLGEYVALSQYGQVRLVDGQGHEVFPFNKYNSIIGGWDGFFIVENEQGEWGVVDRYGTEMISFDRNLYFLDGEMLSHMNPFSWNGYNGLFSVFDHERGVGVIDLSGQEVFPFGYYSSIHRVIGGTFRVTDRQWNVSNVDCSGTGILYSFENIAALGDVILVFNHWPQDVSVIKRGGAEVIPFGRYDNAFIIGNYITLWEENWYRHRIIARSGGDVASPQGFYVVFGIGEGLFYVKTSFYPPSVGVVDAEGREIIPIGTYRLSLCFRGGQLLSFSNENNQWGVIRINP